MKEPTDATSRDSVPPAVRRQRDDYFDSTMIASKTPLTPDTVGSFGLSEGSYYGEQPEITELPNRAVLIGTFTSFKCVMNASGRAIYTEVQVKPSHVFEDVAGGTKSGSKTITILFAGGTVKTKSGQVLSFLTQPRHYFIGPGKSYLMVLTYQPDGDFYNIGKDWDLSDGTVRADNALEERRVKLHGSTLVGLSTQDLIQVLGKRFSVAQ
jgi:hypothetical protein